MAKRKNETSTAVSRIPNAGAVAAGPAAKTSAKANKRQGRPAKTGDSWFVVRFTLAIYVGFLKEKAPKNWNDRRINFVLFSPEIPRDEWKSTDPYNGIGALLERKSMPRLWDGSQVSKGLLWAEKKEMFSGGLQLLFHPYWRLLHFPNDPSEIRFLLTHCKLTYSMGLMRKSAFEVGRDLLPVEIEMASLDREIAEAKKSPAIWKSSFLDLMAIALALTLESQAIGERKRLFQWQAWWRREILLFADWPVGDAGDRESLDRLVKAMWPNLSHTELGITLSSYEYLSRYVMPMNKSTATRGSGKKATTDAKEYQMDELMWVYLSLRDGTRPDLKEHEEYTFKSRGPR